jgi:ubiquinone/menaquinone biosynthesis C-methylase UbiE
MDIWGRIFAASYDRFMAGTERAGLAHHRQTLLSATSGRVLEIGAGTGANLPFYGSAVSELVVSEPEEPMARRLARNIGRHHARARLIRSPADGLPLEPQSFDYVVSTLVLCTVRDPQSALTEVRRVLRPGGRLLFIEHVRSPDPGLARWQDRLRRPWAWFGHGCQCNRATVDVVISSGFSIAELRHDVLRKAPPIVRPLVIGTAVRA